jgi:hypothetical protein
MKTKAIDQSGASASTADASAKVSKRRGLLLGVGAAGAAVIAAKALPGTAPAQLAAAPVKPAPDTSGGYQLSAHVRRYYETTKV